MLSKKKIYNPEEYDTGPQEDGDGIIDFSGIIVNGLQMGFTYIEIRHMRLGEFSDYFETYKPVFNMRTTGATYKIPEKRVSMLSL